MSERIVKVSASVIGVGIVAPFDVWINGWWSLLAVAPLGVVTAEVYGRWRRRVRLERTRANIARLERQLGLIDLTFDYVSDAPGAILRYYPGRVPNV